MSKQKIKKLKEDPRNVLVWEEQDQTDQKKESENKQRIFFQCKETRDKTSSNIRDAALDKSRKIRKRETSCIKKKQVMKTSPLIKSKWWKLLQEEEETVQ